MIGTVQDDLHLRVVAGRQHLDTPKPATGLSDRQFFKQQILAIARLP